ncbi:MAG: RelA/SpoT domain-containing protein [Bacteroidetes bacterium]|nr:RelA/SpoT domain-containing protein [Bacteroidota bacterium]
MKSQIDFFKEYSIDNVKFSNTNYTWNELTDIFDHYEKNKSSLRPSAKEITDTIVEFDNVHSVKYRIKDSEHLIEKIIRKKIDKPKSVQISIDNYIVEIKDLIGVRALHLFKDDWLAIDEKIRKSFKVIGKPIANIRLGDSTEYVKLYKDNGCSIKIHERGYRSVHYTIKKKIINKDFYPEIQVRTLYEEAWSEIDHKMRYPYNLNDILLNNFLDILNVLSGSADMMGNFVKILRSKMEEKEKLIQKLDTELKGKNNTQKINEFLKYIANKDMLPFVSGSLVNPATSSLLGDIGIIPGPSKSLKPNKIYKYKK